MVCNFIFDCVTVKTENYVYYYYYYYCCYYYYYYYYCYYYYYYYYYSVSSNKALGKNTFAGRRKSVSTLPLFVRQFSQMCSRSILGLNLTSILCSEFYGYD